jgi:DNA-binding HxlR family transcriptional regulator
MEKSAIKDLIYGGLEELINNQKYYYHSTVGHTYSHLTEKGEDAIVEFMNLMSWKMKEADNADLERRAKEQVLNALKVKE